MCAIPSIFRSSCYPGTASSRLTTLPLGHLQRELAGNAASRLVQQGDIPTAGTTESRRFEHDRLDRLLGQDLRSGANPAQALDQYRYTWDLAGNRSSYRYENGSGVWTYTHSTPSSSNRLDSVTGPTGKLAYSYDAAGFPKGDGARSYTWRASGWLDRLTRDGLTTRYTYNGLAQRVAKLSGSTPGTAADTRLYTYDEAGHLLGEYTATGALIQEHVWLGDTPLALIDPQGVKLVFADQLDTPRRITDTNGKALWKWNGEAFGLSLPNEDADGDGKALTYNLRFPGQVFDKESNLHYNWHRYYDPGTGRYISSDPIGLNGGVNTYGYVGGRPLAGIDPTGLVPIPFYIPNSKVVEFARKRAKDFGKDLSNCSNADILDFVKFLPQKTVDDFQASYEKRPAAPRDGKPLSPALNKLNNDEYAKEKAILDKALFDWLKARQAANKPCDCIK